MWFDNNSEQKQWTVCKGEAVYITHTNVGNAVLDSLGYWHVCCPFYIIGIRFLLGSKRGLAPHLWRYYSLCSEPRVIRIYAHLRRRGRNLRIHTQPAFLWILHLHRDMKNLVILRCMKGTSRKKDEKKIRTCRSIKKTNNTSNKINDASMLWHHDSEDLTFLSCLG